MMAKKKAVKPKDEEEGDLDEFVDELLDDEEVESEYPKLGRKIPEEKVKSAAPPIEEIDVSEAEEEIEFELEEEPRFPDYKYLNVSINKGIAKNDHEVVIEGQSHGFCNILVKHLLKTEGVNIAAYKITDIDLPKILIRLEDNKKYKIKDILYKAIEFLREEVVEVQELFQKLT